MSVAERKVKTARKIRMGHVMAGWSQGRVRRMDIRSGDNVEILAGRYRGKQGVVERVTPEDQTVVVRGLNMHKRHVRAGMKGAIQGGIVDFAAPISYSNVALVCNKCNKKTRIAKEQQTGGEWQIVCKECGKPYERSAKA